VGWGSSGRESPATTDGASKYEQERAAKKNHANTSNLHPVLSHNIATGKFLKEIQTKQRRGAWGKKK